MSASEPCAANDWLSAHALCLIDSYERMTGRQLISPVPGQHPARCLFEADAVIASHGPEPDPIFNYGNRRALALFETDWATFTRMPSRLSAATAEQQERSRLLAKVAQSGFADDYRGERVSRTGRRFLIEHATVWNVLSEAGEIYGQAVCFRDWRYL